MFSEKPHNYNIHISQSGSSMPQKYQASISKLNEDKTKTSLLHYNPQTSLNVVFQKNKKGGMEYGVENLKTLGYKK